MAHGQFRHANSPSEIAAREAREASGAAKDAVKGFRHYNHPEEVAARARAQGVTLPKLPEATPERVLAVESVVIPGPGPRTAAPLERLRALENKVEELVTRLEQRVDQALTDLFGSPEELQALRLTMANLPAIQEQGLKLRNRVKALEDTIDAEFARTQEPPAQDAPAPANEEPPAPEAPATPEST